MNKFYTYEEYLKENNITDEERFEECEECYGEGTHECSCGNYHDCEECKGSGRLDIEYPKYQQLREKQELKYEQWQKDVGVK